MQMFRLILIAFTIIIVGYTLAAVANDGANLLPHFFAPIVALTWQGQFNLDFTTYLILSGIWMAWRGGFTRGSVALGILAPPFGILFFAPYLIYLVTKTSGDARKLLLGVHAE
jgi:hypothetical protein